MNTTNSASSVLQRATYLCSFFLAIGNLTHCGEPGSYSADNKFELLEVVGYAVKCKDDGSADQAAPYQFSIIESGPNHNNCYTVLVGLTQMRQKNVSAARLFKFQCQGD